MTYIWRLNNDLDCQRTSSCTLTNYIEKSLHPRVISRHHWDKMHHLLNRTPWHYTTVYDKSEMPGGKQTDFKKFYIYYSTVLLPVCNSSNTCFPQRLTSPFSSFKFYLAKRVMAAKAPALISTSSTALLIKLQGQIAPSLFQYKKVHNLWHLTKLSWKQWKHKILNFSLFFFLLPFLVDEADLVKSVLALVSKEFGVWLMKAATFSRIWQRHAN